MYLGDNGTNTGNRPGSRRTGELEEAAHTPDISWEREELLGCSRPPPRVFARGQLCHG